ncbi:Secreted protein OS=Streptomyces alboniger OX=132473 GN=CP975_07800 PE=4 SV=1 [Streptomyces alboniger]
MNIDWAALGSVFGVSLVVTVALVGLFTLGIIGLSKQETASAAGGGSATLARTGAYACFALCAAAVAYGIFLIVA